MARRRVAAAHSLPVYRMEMQSGLPLLLVVQQRSQGYDRRCGQAFDRLVALNRFARAGSDGWRAIAETKVYSQDRRLQREEEHLRLPADEWALDEAGCHRSTRRCRHCNCKSRSGLREGPQVATQSS